MAKRTAKHLWKFRHTVKMHRSKCSSFFAHGYLLGKPKKCPVLKVTENMLSTQFTTPASYWTVRMFVKKEHKKIISEGKASAKPLPLCYFGVRALCHVTKGVIYETVWRKLFEKWREEPK